MAVIMAVDDREVSITVNYVITNRFPVLWQYFASPGDFFALDRQEVARSYQEYFRPCRPAEKRLVASQITLANISPLLSLLYLLVVRCGWQWQQTNLGSETTRTLFSFFPRRTEDPEVRNPSSSRPHAHVRTDPPHPLYSGGSSSGPEVAAHFPGAGDREKKEGGGGKGGKIVFNNTNDHINKKELDLKGQ